MTTSTTRILNAVHRDKGGQVFNVDHKDYGADPTGAVDSATAIANAFAAVLAAGGGTLAMPGSYKIASPLVFSITGSTPKGVRILCNPAKTTFTPVGGAGFPAGSAAVTFANEPNTDGGQAIDVYGMKLDGLNLSGVDGYVIGNNAGHLSQRIRMHGCEAHRFTGTVTAGLANGLPAANFWVRDTIKSTFNHCYGGRGGDNWRIGGGSDANLPTTCSWYGGDAREAVTKGVRLISGYKMRWYDFVREANGEEGIYAAPTGGLNLTGIVFTGGWDEDNWHSLLGTPASRVLKAHVYADGTSAGTISITMRDQTTAGITRAVDFKKVVNFAVVNPTPYVLRTTGTNISATATGYNRSTGSWITDGYIVGQQLRVRGFATAGNNGTKTITAVTASDISVAGNSVEAVGPSVTIVLQSFFFDVNCVGELGEWPINNVPLDIVANSAPINVNGLTAYARGRFTIDPDTGDIVPSTSGLYSFGTTVFRWLNIWLSGKLTSVNAEITSILTMTGAIVGNSGGNKDVLLQPGNSAGAVMLRDSTGVVVARTLNGGIFRVDGKMTLPSVGNHFEIAAGTNAAIGLATLVAGSVVVSNTLVTANSQIQLTVKTPGGTMGFLSAGTRTAGTSFTITSSSGTDTSTVEWQITEKI